MQKLSRINKYKDYRNELNNDGEREIATQELRELQEKIIFNEKRFGSSSRTESDLSRGRRSTSFDGYNVRPNINSESNISNFERETKYSSDLDDIFSELNKYKNVGPRVNEIEEQDDYIKRIKEIVSNAGAQHDKIDDYQEATSFKNEYLKKNDPIEELLPEEEPTPIENIRKHTPQPQPKKDTSLAEFDEPTFEPANIKKESQLNEVAIEKPVIKPIVPQVDHSKEFKDICENVNSLAEEIEESSSFAQIQHEPHPRKSMPETSFEGIQQTVKKDLLNSDDSFMDNLKQEVEQYSKEEQKIIEVKEKYPENKIVNKEMNAQMKQEYDNTISLEVSKLVNEINSSKVDNISTDDIIKGYDLDKNDTFENQSGKTIAFELNKKDVPDNTIVVSHPDLNDSSIHTMSFKTEELDVEDGKTNTLLNIILSILILIAVAALVTIIYFFLITRGII